MSILTSILGGAPRQRFDSQDLATLIWGREAKSGVQVDPANALRVATVFGACRVIAEDVSKVPLGLYQDRSDGSKVKAVDHSLHEVLARRPNAWMTSMEFRETLTYHAVLCQGGFAVINRVNGEVRELLPLVPGNVRVIRRADWSLVYEVAGVGMLDQGQVLHVRGPSWTGTAGFELVRQATEAIGLAMVTEESQARLHANGTRGGGLLSTDQKLDKDRIDRIRSQWSDAYGGVTNAMRTMVLDAGMKFTQMSMTGVDAQHLETRKHQVEEICRFFRVHPTKLFLDTKSASYASMEQNAISHVQDTLLPWYTRWEQAIDRDLLSPAEVRAGFYAHHAVQGLLRGDSAARSAMYKSGINDGWMTRNEARSLEELNPLPELDKPLKPLNMETVDPKVEEPTMPALDGGDGSSAAAVQDTALNGAQVASLLAIVQAVAAGDLPAATAREMIRASFPAVSEATIDAMLAGLEGWEAPEAPETTPEPPDPADDPAEDAAEETTKTMAVALARVVEKVLEPRSTEVVFTYDADGKCVGLKPKE